VTQACRHLTQTVSQHSSFTASAHCCSILVPLRSLRAVESNMDSKLKFRVYLLLLCFDVNNPSYRLLWGSSSS
jgi:hypothetical protein